MNNTLKKYIALFLILSISLFSLSGCYGHSVYNIDHLAYAVAIGIDTGKLNRLRISFQLSIPGGSSEGGGSSQSDNTVINTIECSSIDSGINLLNSYISKEVNLSHCKVIVFSEDFAYNGISESLYTLMNNIQIRPDSNIIISRCSAEYFLNSSKPTLEKISARYYEVAPSSSDYTGYTEDITLSKFFSNFASTTSQCYGILGGVNSKSTQNTDVTEDGSKKDSNNKANETLITSKPTIENMGLAVFRDDKLVGELTGIETICHLIISNKLNICNITINSPFEDGKTITLRIRLVEDTKNKVTLTDAGPYINSKIRLEARVLTMDENSKYLDTQNIEKLEKYTTSYMKNQIYQYLYKVSKEYNSDIDGFGLHVTKNFSTWEKWRNYKWLDNFKNSFFNVEVETKVKSGYILMET